MAMNQLRVAAAQIAVELANIKHNLQTHRQIIEQAKAQQVELLVFPELSLTGYQLTARVPELAISLDDPRLLELAAECQGIQVVCGLVEQASPGEYYNAMVWLCDGKVQYLHRKLYLPTYGGLEEGKWFSASQHLELQRTRNNWSAATLICADLWNPALVHATMLKRPDILLAGINSAEGAVSDSFSNPQGWSINLQFYAMSYGVPIIMANRCDKELNAKFWGGSRILNARGKTLAQAGDQPQLVIADLQRNEIAQARFELPTIRDANTPLIKSLL